MTKQTLQFDSGAGVRLRGTVNRVVKLLMPGPSQPPALAEARNSDDLRAISEEAVAQTIHAWRSRPSYFPAQLLGEPVWGMLLELLQAELEGRRVTLSRLCVVGGVGQSAARRWLKAAAVHGLVLIDHGELRDEDEYVELSPKGSRDFRRYFQDVEAAI